MTTKQITIALDEHEATALADAANLALIAMRSAPETFGRPLSNPRQQHAAAGINAILEALYDLPTGDASP